MPVHCIPLRWLCVILGLVALRPAARAAEPERRPNVLFIAVDDLRDWVTFCGRNPQSITPHFDRLAAKGTAFSRAYCVAPVCNPSRTALMSGLRPSSTGVYDNGNDWRTVVPLDLPLTAAFRRAGYFVCGAGKIYHEAFRRPDEWDDYLASPGADPAPAAGQDTGVGGIRFAPLDRRDDELDDWKITEYGIKQLERPHDRPFFLAVGLHKPHMPWYVPRKYYDMFPLERIELPPYRADDLADVPAAGQRLAGPEGDHALMVASGRWQEAVQGYLAAIAYTDMNLGRLLDALERSPERDRTIVCLWSDHGWHLGEKSHWRKFTLWEEATRSPLIWVVPGLTRPGGICERPIDFMSIYPTLMDVCGLPTPAHVQGTSIRRLLADPAAEWTEPAVTTHKYRNHAVRVAGWRYIRYADGDEELYDERNDPNEWTNLATRPEHAATKAALAAALPRDDHPDIGGAPRAAQRPNILWIVLDDVSPHFSCYGDQTIHTPHVDRLAREGTRFTRAFVTAPVCSPCRSALITGCYQTTIGAHHHRSGRGVEKIRLPAGVRPIPELLQEAGYYTCIGSGLEGENRAGKKPAADGELGKTDYNFTWDPGMFAANDWAGRMPGQPFFMQAQLSGGKLRGNSVESARRLAERAAAELGGATDPATVELPPSYPRDPVLLGDWAAYLDAIRLTDEHVGRIVARLESEGILDETLVILCADNGISHARGKQFLYDEGTRTPLIVRGPGIAPGVVRDDLVELIDVAAVSLAAAGISPPPTMQARDLFAADHRPRDAVFAARDRCDETVDRIRSVRTNRFLYIRNFHPQRPLLQPNAYKDSKSILQVLRSLHAAGALDPLQETLLFSPTRPAEELYEWPEDRWQVKNLADDPAHAETLARLRARLEVWMAETHDPGAESEAMYDSDMAVYLAAPWDAKTDAIRRTMALMKQWAREGK